MTNRRARSHAIALGLAAAMLWMAIPVSASGDRRPGRRRAAHAKRATHSNDVHTSGRRLGTLSHRGISASGLGAGSFLLGGPLGWGIYRGVDLLRRR